MSIQKYEFKNILFKIVLENTKKKQKKPKKQKKQKTERKKRKVKDNDKTMGLKNNIISTM